MGLVKQTQQVLLERKQQGEKQLAEKAKVSQQRAAAGNCPLAHAVMAQATPVGNVGVGWSVEVDIVENKASPKPVVLPAERMEQLASLRSMEYFASHKEWLTDTMKQPAPRPPSSSQSS